MSKTKKILNAVLKAASFLSVLIVLGCASVGGPAGQMSHDSREALLKERVMKMWQAQITGDRATMYDMYDPFFRAKVKKGQFADKDMTFIKYYNPAIESVDMKGNVASVRVKMEYEVRDLILPKGKKYSEPTKANVTNETWLFVDGTWYRQFIDYITDSSFAKY